jgi:hypothetical protein
VDLIQVRAEKCLIRRWTAEIVGDTLAASCKIFESHSTRQRQRGLQVPEVAELTKLLGTNFVQRRDVKAWQRDNGEWFPDETPMSLADFTAHLDGSKTMGHYMVDQEDHCRLFAFDIDLRSHKDAFQGPCEYTWCEEQGVHKHGWIYDQQEKWLRDEWLKDESPFKERLTIQLRCMAEGLALKAARKYSVPVAICDSGGKGLHVYVFTGPIPAEMAIQMGDECLDEAGLGPTRGTNFYQHAHGEYQSLEIELFPKQASLDGKKLGNLMKLPLGVNRKTGRRSEFISCRAGYNRLVPMDAERALTGDLPWE